MISINQLKVILVLSVILWAIVLSIKQVPLSIDLWSPYPIVLAILSAIMWIYDKWLWKWWIIHRWFVKTPNINGTWKGHLRTTYVDTATKKPAEKEIFYMSICQTYSKLFIRAVFKRSSSVLKISSIEKSDDDQYMVGGIYTNEPQLSERASSPIHYGGVFITIVGNPPTELKGQYWTDRNTAGEFELSEWSPGQHQDYANADKIKFKKIGE